jgi:hypothetical protein
LEEVKDTLLTIVQDILSAMDSDEVNSINDTTESLQVARIVRNTFYDIVDRSDLPVDQSLFNLIPSGSALQPTVMFLPSNVSNLDWLKYDCQQVGETDPNYRDLIWVSPKSFFDMTDQLQSTDSTVGHLNLTIGTNAVAYFYKNDQAPRFYTAYDDNTILFDSYDSGVELTLQSSKTQAAGRQNETFSVTDSFIPPLNDAQFSLLRNEAKSLAFAELKQTVHAKAEGTSKRLWTALQRNKRQIKGKTAEFDRLPNYGRK